MTDFRKTQDVEYFANVIDTMPKRSVQEMNILKGMDVRLSKKTLVRLPTEPVVVKPVIPSEKLADLASKFNTKA